MKRFYKHLSTWMFTSVFLMVLFFVLRMPPWITLIVVAGWGMSIAAEAFEVFGFPGMDRDWEERKIQQELERMSENTKPEEVDLDQLNDSEREDL
ncbi:MAG: 2TM domain-containing protein, partial [Saprospiraceae bacterium]|nr:2TM domain-containing protein [Saprospiraceae bacterium]